MEPMYYSSMLLVAFLLGGIHALDADHIATVSTMLSERRPLKRTVMLALKWALGHGLALLILAGMYLGVKVLLANVPLTVMERVVGLAMIYIGVMLYYREWNRRKNPVDFQARLTDRPDSLLFGMGVLHGTAGWSSVVLMLPVSQFEAPGWILVYILLFNLGMILTMGAYGVLFHKLTTFKSMSHHLPKLRLASATLMVLIGLRLVSEVYG